MTNPEEAFKRIDAALRKQADAVMPEWESCSLVYEMGEGEGLGNFGYAFSGDARKPFALDDDELDAMVLSLRKVMPFLKGELWHQALFQVPRNGRGIAMSVEFEDPRKWSIRPESAEADIKALRIPADISALVPEDSSGKTGLSR